MNRPLFFIDVRRYPREDLERDLRNGGLFVPGTQHPLNQQVEVTFRLHDAEQSVAARVVFSDGHGVGLELLVPAHERARLMDRIRWTREQPAVAEVEALAPAQGGAASWGELGGGDGDDADGDDADGDDADGDDADGGDGDDADGGDGDDVDRDDGGDPAARRQRKLAELRRRRAEAKLEPVHVRNLGMAEQLKLAHQGEQQERILLERLYGKTVWEALLRNPRISAPEVARIARMGALPKPLLEIIVGNSGWLQVAEVRRALLGNPRLAPEMIGRVLRLLPKHELKIVPGQLAYPAAVRDVARRMLKE